MNSKIKKSDALKTFDFGALEGQDQTKERDEYIHKNIINNPHKSMSEEGESWNEAVNRVVPFMKDLVKNAKPHTSVVTHNSVFGLINLWDKHKRPDEFDQKQREDYTKQDNTAKTGSHFTIKGDNGPIHIVRHGETKDNEDKKFRRSDTELTEKGVKQAQEVGKALSKHDIPEVYSSPLDRSIHTSNLLMDEQSKKNAKNGGWLDNYGEEENANEGKIVSGPMGSLFSGTTGKGRDYSPAWGGQFAMGGSMPGAVGFTYARTGSTPSNGKFAKKTMASAQNGELLPADFHKQYLNSPNYRKRLQSSGYNVNEELQARKANLAGTTVYQERPGFFEALKDFRLQPSPGSHYEEGAVNMDYPTDVKQIKQGYKGEVTMPTKSEIEAHELGHAVTGIYEDYRLNPFDNRNLKGRSMNLPYVNFHDKMPSENKADLDAYRYMLKKQGLYDTGTQTFTKEHLKAPIKSMAKDRLLRNYSEKNLIWLMNNIAKTDENNDNVTYAQQGAIIDDEMGQWAHPGEITRIPSNNITMRGVPYNVLGISDTGDKKLMKPGKNYKFNGKRVTEFPMAEDGSQLTKLDQLTNFTNYNTPQPGGWLDKYNK